MNLKSTASVIALLILAPFAAFANSPTLATHASATGNNVVENLTRPPSSPGRGGSYFDWGRAQNGFGYCYEWTYDGAVLNGGRPVSNSYCEYSNPSRFNWGRANDGWGYCFQWTPYNDAMNEGRPVSNSYCESYSPSYFAWGRANDGYTYCFQYTSNGIPMNQGRPVSSNYCRY